MAKKKENNIQLKEEYTLLALDPSLNCTGWSVLNITHEISQNNSTNFKDISGNDIYIKLVDYGIIPTKSLEEGQSLLLIEHRLEELFKKYDIDYITVENPFASANRVVIQRLAATHAIIKLVVARHQKPNVVGYSVMTAKSITLAGDGKELHLKKDNAERKSGEELKQEVANSVLNILGSEQFIKEYNLDITDSISIGICFITLAGQPQPKPKKQKKVKNTKNKEENVEKQEIKQKVIKEKNKSKKNEKTNATTKKVTKDSKKVAKNSKVNKSADIDLTNEISNSISDMIKNNKDK